MSLSRRNLITGGAGALALAAYAQSLQVFAATGKSPQRLIVYLQANGIGGSLDVWGAPGILKGNTVINNATKFPVWMGDLSQFGSRMIALNGLHCIMEDRLHGCGRALLTSRKSAFSGESATEMADGAGKFFGPTFDSLINKNFSQNGLYYCGSGFETQTVFSTGADQSVPLSNNPMRALAKAMGTQTAAQTDVSASQILSFAQERAKLYRQKIPSSEYTKFDEYVDSLAQVSKSAQQPEPVGATSDYCLVSNAQAASADFPGKGSVNLDPARAAAIHKLMEVMVFNMACGNHSFGGLQVGRGPDGQNLSNVRNGEGTHFFFHDYANPAAMGQFQLFYADRLAYLLWLLSKTKDIDDKMMIENTTVLWMSDSGGAHHMGASQIPALLIGGNLFKEKGKVLQFKELNPGIGYGNEVGRGTNASECRGIADLYLSIFQGFGMNVSSFGDPAFSKGPLPGLV